MGISIETARKHLDAWLEAELKVCNNQSYTIGSRSLSRANLNDIRKEIDYWKNEVAKLENLEKRKDRNRAYRVIPRDL